MHGLLERYFYRSLKPRNTQTKYSCKLIWGDIPINQQVWNTQSKYSSKLTKEITSINNQSNQTQCSFLHSSTAENIKFGMHHKFSPQGYFDNFFNIHYNLIQIAFVATHVLKGVLRTTTRALWHNRTLTAVGQRLCDTCSNLENKSVMLN